jgi:Reverse transcriptase (RNA-dependent DNA polymerase)
MRIEQFRPISLENCSFKIITKILATRISIVMDRLINHTQTAFIKDRNIHDNIICAQ